MSIMEARPSKHINGILSNKEITRMCGQQALPT
jgi:hypothetical protein